MKFTENIALQLNFSQIGMLSHKDNFFFAKNKYCIGDFFMKTWSFHVPIHRAPIPSDFEHYMLLLGIASRELLTTLSRARWSKNWEHDMLDLWSSSKSRLIQWCGVRIKMLLLAHKGIKFLKHGCMHGEAGTRIIPKKYRHECLIYKPGKVRSRT